MEQGKVYLLPLEVSGKVVVARQYKGYFRFYIIKKKLIELVNSLVEENAFYGNYVHKSVPKEGSWALIGEKSWTLEETKKIPFLYRQNMFNYTDCVLVHPSLIEPIPVEYHQCIDYRRSLVYNNWDFLKTVLLSILMGQPNKPWDEVYRLKIPGVDKPS
jgi:hypothetical protein